MTLMWSVIIEKNTTMQRRHAARFTPRNAAWFCAIVPLGTASYEKIIEAGGSTCRIAVQRAAEKLLTAQGIG